MSMTATEKDRIQGCLVTMWRDAESNKHLTEQEIAALREPVWPMSMSDPKVTLLREGLKAFSDSVDCILTIDELYDVFSKAEIEKLVQDALFQILDSSPQTVEARATLAVSNLEPKLFEPAVDWTVLFPITNISVPSEGFTLGKVSFHTAGDIRFFIETIRKALGR